MLKEQVQRMTELMNSDANVFESRSRSIMRPKNDSHFKKFNTSVGFREPEGQSITKCENAITQTLLEMRETQILKMQTEIEEKARENQELRQRLSRQTQQSIRELSEANIKLNQYASQMAIRDQQLATLTQLNDSVTKSLDRMTHLHDNKLRHQIAILSGCVYIWVSFFLHTKTLTLLLCIAIAYYGSAVLF